MRMDLGTPAHAPSRSPGKDSFNLKAGLRQVAIVAWQERDAWPVAVMWGLGLMIVVNLLIGGGSDPAPSPGSIAGGTETATGGQGVSVEEGVNELAWAVLCWVVGLMMAVVFSKAPHRNVLWKILAWIIAFIVAGSVGASLGAVTAPGWDFGRWILAGYGWAGAWVGLFVLDSITRQFFAAKPGQATTQAGGGPRHRGPR